MGAFLNSALKRRAHHCRDGPPLLRLTIWYIYIHHRHQSSSSSRSNIHHSHGDPPTMRKNHQTPIFLENRISHRHHDSFFGFLSAISTSQRRCTSHYRRPNLTWTKTPPMASAAITTIAATTALPETESGIAIQSRGTVIASERKSLNPSKNRIANALTSATFPTMRSPLPATLLHSSLTAVQI